MVQGLRDVDWLGWQALLSGTPPRACHTTLRYLSLRVAWEEIIIPAVNKAISFRASALRFNSPALKLDARHSSRPSFADERRWL